MYLAMVAGLMFALPIASIIVEWFAISGSDLLFLTGKWFVFWALGLRLLTAGIKQIAQPEFTARTIFEIKDPSAFTVVSELGISNVAIGVLGTGSLFFPAWVLPSAVYGVLFYGIAGIRHLANKRRNPTENIATISDLWVALVLAVYLGASFLP